MLKFKVKKSKTNDTVRFKVQGDNAVLLLGEVNTVLQ